MRRRGIARSSRPSLLGTMGRTAVVAGTATAVSGNVAKRQQAAAQAATPMAPQNPPPAPPAPEPATSVVGDDVITRLRQLAELRDQGILTEEEFAEQKARLLA